MGGGVWVGSLSLPEQKSRWFYNTRRGLLSSRPKNFEIPGLQNFGCEFNKIHQELVRQRATSRIKNAWDLGDSLGDAF